jgi:SPP1 gp7 family putative phage head morphogenesis protein
VIAATALDARSDRLRSRERFRAPAASDFERALRAVAARVGAIVKRFAPKGAVDDVAGLKAALDKYSVQLEPWAKRQVQLLLATVERKNKRAWHQQGLEIGRALVKEIRGPVGEVVRGMMHEQVGLITSLPREAAERVQELSLRALTKGGRSEGIAREIMRTGAVTLSRAKLIARTETGRASTALTQARALELGSEGYVWRTSRDPDVREDHRKLEGRIIPWDDPPIAGPNGQRYHAGAGPACRCYAEPVIPEHQ